jgi:hypothetical protein
MTQSNSLPDPEKLKQTVNQLRESNRQLDIVTLALDELIARIDEDLRQQQGARSVPTATRLQAQKY